MGSRSPKRSRRSVLLRAASVLLLAGALGLFWLAFTQFDGSGPSGAAPQDQASFEESLVRDARLSVAFGLAGCFALLGAFACYARIRAKEPGPPPDPQP